MASHDHPGGIGHLRCSDSDRELVADVLGRAFSEGRITFEEHDERLNRAYAARTFAELDAITSDPGWNGGDYASPADVADGLRRHADIWAVMGLSTEFWRTEFWRGIELPDVTWDTVEEFRERFLRATFAVMDPNALLTMGWKWQRGDVARNANGDLSAALGRVTAKTFVMPIDEDMFFPPRDCRREQELAPGSELRVLHSIAGHFGLFGFEESFLAEVDEHLKELLDTEL